MTQLCTFSRGSLPRVYDLRRKPSLHASFHSYARPTCLQRQQGGADSSEGEWARQLVPGSDAARRPLLRVVASLPKSAASGRDLSELQERSSFQATTVPEQFAGDRQGGASQEAGTAAETDSSGSGLLARWDAVPGKYRAVVATSFSFVICNMDKVNISVAIIPMAQDFGWSPTISGLIQSSFFYGYLLSQIPGGYLTSILGGRRVLPAGVALWSLATAGVPVLASTIPGLMASRAAVGLGEGVAPSAATDIAARSVDASERARAVSLIFGGLHVGSLLGLIVAPYVIQHFGWPAVFYLFGGFGLLWSLWWEQLMARIAVQEPQLAAALVHKQPHGPSSQQGSTALAAEKDEGDSMPWRAFIRNRPLQALAYTHFCNNWFHYTFLAWLPTYFTNVLSLDLTRAAQVSILPPVAAIAVSAIAGPSADALLSAGVPVATVRKVAQCMAFLGPAACLLAAGMLEEDPGDGLLLVGLIALSLGLGSFSLAGLYCNHPDLSPRYAPVLLGITNTSGALPGIIGVACTGWLYDVTGSWSMALFAPSIFFFVTGSAVYAAFGSAERQDFQSSNQPFRLEVRLRRLFRAAGLHQRAAQRRNTTGPWEGPVISLQRFARGLRGDGLKE